MPSSISIQLGPVFCNPGCQHCLAPLTPGYVWYSCPDCGGVCTGLYDVNGAEFCNCQFEEEL